MCEICVIYQSNSYANLYHKDTIEETTSISSLKKLIQTNFYIEWHKFYDEVEGSGRADDKC